METDFMGRNKPMIHDDFLGRGWGFPVKPAPECRIVMTEDEENIQQAIWIILATAPGERLMRPDFGCGIHKYVFALNDDSTMGGVVREVREALILWEPRIDVLDVDAHPREYGELLLVNIHYRVRSTNNFFNLVYPFYLARG
jgi:hypothetical protein